VSQYHRGRGVIVWESIFHLPKRELSQRDLFSQKAFHTDRRFLRRILSNLVHNALKFTDEGSLWIQGGSSGEGGG
jgi:signal transduction histidine kinase